MPILYEKCLRCGRKLKSESSKELGFGKVCWEKYNSEDNYKELFHIEEEKKCEKSESES